MSAEPRRGKDGQPILEIDIQLPLGEGAVDIQLRTTASRVAIFGPSGGGKSTLLRTLAGVERRATGRVMVAGSVWMDSGHGICVSPWDRGVGWVPQDYLLFPHLSVRENMAYAQASPSAVEEMARILFLDHLLDRRPRRLSGGEQQRVALGRALLRRPSLLLLDEPFSALDRPLRAHVAKELLAFSQREGVPLLLVSHDEMDAAAVTQEEWSLSQGRLKRVD